MCYIRFLPEKVQLYTVSYIQSYISRGWRELRRLGEGSIITSGRTVQTVSFFFFFFKKKKKKETVWTVRPLVMMEPSPSRRNYYIILYLYGNIDAQTHYIAPCSHFFFFFQWNMSPKPLASARLQYNYFHARNNIF